MDWLWWCIGTAAFLAFAVLLTAFICFMRVFYFKSRKPLGEDEFELPVGDIYEVFREDMINWIRQARSMLHEDVEIESYDGLKLRGRYYEYAPGAPMEILFHGYEGNSERDLSGGIERCFALGRNALLVDQRGSGRSDGHITTFGIKERKDCKKWVEFAVERFGPDVRIGITGVSMGAATVIMASAEDLPDNVKFVLADCGYSSAKAILLKVIGEIGLPANTVYFFVRLGARIFGGFDPEETSPLEAARLGKRDIIFVHGDTDAFVPFDMSREMFDACNSKRKRLISIPNAGHGLAYPVGRKEYIDALKEIEKDWNL
jgi:fermentation-respiration switch protein FrsA (DUF1100 family)